MQIGPQELFLWALLVLSGVQFFFPDLFWSWSEGWKVQGDSEPSDSWLFMTRFGSFIGVIIIGYMLYKVRHPSF